MRVELSLRESVALGCAVAVGCYAYPLLDPARAWEFLYNWDDEENFLDNDAIQALSWANVYDMLTICKIHVYEPLGWLLKALVFQIAGMDSRAVRIATLALHLLAGWVLAQTAALVIAIVQIGSGMEAGRTRAARGVVNPDAYLPGCMLSVLLLFVLHPLNAEVVAWPSAQPYALAALFASLSMYHHCRLLHDRLSSFSDSLDVVMHSKRKVVAAAASADDKDRSKAWQRVAEIPTIPQLHRNSLLTAVFYLCAVLSKSASVLVPVAIALLDLVATLPAAYATLHVRCGQLPTRSLAVRMVLQYIKSRMLLLSVLCTFVAVTLLANKDGMASDTDSMTLTLQERLIVALMSPAVVLGHAIWPVGLRPYYQIREDSLHLWTNPTCLLSISLLIGAAWWVVAQLRQRQFVPFATFAYYNAMLLPTSGLVPHGMVTLTTDRYAYFPMMVFIPIGGIYLTKWLRLDDLDHASARFRAQDAPRTPELSRSDEDDAHDESKHVPDGQFRDQRSYQPAYHDLRAAYALVVCVMVLVSSQQLDRWRNMDVLTQYTIEQDPSDWRTYSIRADYIFNHGGASEGSNAHCNDLWNLSHYFSPSKSLKAKLFRLKLLYVLGQVSKACQGYFSLLESDAEYAIVQNNAGMCFFANGDHEEGRRRVVRALELAKLQDHRKRIHDNVMRLDAWAAKVATANGADVPFHGRLLW